MITKAFSLQIRFEKELYENQKVVISSSVTNLGSSAFEDCTVLTEVSFADDSHLKTIPQRTFASCPRLKPVGLPIGMCLGIAIGTGAFASCGSYLNSVEIPATVIKLWDTGIDAFEGPRWRRSILLKYEGWLGNP